MENLIKIKAWKVFALIIIVPALIIILGAILVKMTNMTQWTMIAAICAALTMCITYFGWLWTVAQNVHKKYTNIFRPSFNTFNYLFFGSISLGFIILPMLKAFLTSEFDSFLGLLGLVTPLCFLLCVYLIARSLGRGEKQEFNKENNILIDSVLIWLLPLGIWFIRPRIKKLLYSQQLTSD